MSHTHGILKVKGEDADMYLAVAVAVADCVKVRNHGDNVLRCTIIKRALDEGEKSGIQCL